MKQKLLLCCILSIAFVNAFCADYYVRTDGDDANPGTGNTPGEAWQTMDHAIRSLKAGDHLFVNDGLYETNQLVVKNIHGSPDKITRISAINRW